MEPTQKQRGNKMQSLVDVIRIRDELSLPEAIEIVNEMREEVANGANPEEVLYAEGLEPDYFFDLV